MSEMAEDRNGRISISEDKLYRALTELELRLIRQLASQDEVSGLSRRVTNVEQRVSAVKEFHDEVHALKEAQKVLQERALNPEKVTTLIQKALQDNEARGWTARERWVGYGLAFLTFASFCTNLFVALKK